MLETSVDVLQPQLTGRVGGGCTLATSSASSSG
jgi:hypothetical protein